VINTLIQDLVQTNISFFKSFVTRKKIIYYQKTATK
jgi:hypothetical protein